MLGIRRARVVERRGVDGLEIDLLRRQQSIDQCELIVDLIVRVCVKHHVNFASRGLKQGHACGGEQLGKRHCMPSTFQAGPRHALDILPLQSKEQNNG